MSDLPPLQFLTFADFVRLSSQLATQIKTESQPFDLIISINRGGSVISRILSDLLVDLPIMSFGMASYRGINQNQEISVTQEFTHNIFNKKVLLVDEICDTGQTFAQALKYLAPLQPQFIKTAALFVKPHSIFTPDFTTGSVSAWVVFPYDVRETLVNLAKFWLADDKLKDQLITHFHQVGVPSDVLDTLVTEIAKSQGTK